MVYRHPHARHDTRTGTRSNEEYGFPHLVDVHSALLNKGNIMNYVDGFVIAVPTANREMYRQYAELGAKIFKRHGALSLVECWGDDVPEGKLTSFPMAVKCQADETVVFAWLIWPSKQMRNEGMKKVMDDPESKPMMDSMPFDGKRMIFGGFEVLVQT
jgi:uncharacterized protein YbaA (DUF1428 family)